ncbi:efflux RND transporter periplasmic adaptor subunit [Echinicola marina]|uniref:efflux RND transporter periplasmic adaptor subunit n=1 Tax=Echinicola marina TaxID=2859768 RepID=UPI001CF66B1B|nr:efflux RND transporter periplasmic adaptor subunit [Echinicola marina]UCS92475.1 efflux RND transporter periplasmic adaptor subunit [Echinicola marina]
MKFKYLYNIIFIVLLSACNPSDEKSLHNTKGGAEDHSEHENDQSVHLSADQVEALQIKVDSIPKRIITGIVEANGVLEVPPQNEANITAIIGANVNNIKVIEGDKVHKGQIIAYVSHPDLIQLQIDYQQKWNELKFVQLEYERQKTLFENEVGAGKEFQQIKANLAGLRGNVTGMESQLNLLGISPKNIQKGNISANIPIKSPISGYVKKVHIKTGQYVSPQFTMFEVVNIEHIHADLMVFEKDIYKVKVGQKVRFKVQTLPEDELYAEVYAVGKSFEEKPKAVHIHAEIANKKGLLIPGMYVRGQVIIDGKLEYAVKEGAIAKSGEKHFLFAASKNGKEWDFKPIEVLVTDGNDSWKSIKFLNAADQHQQFVMNQAYYIMAEMNKGEGGHHH